MDTPNSALTLTKLRTQECTLEELQAALIALIELHNKFVEDVAQALSAKQDKPWRASL